MRAAVALTLVAFSLQSFMTQTHIHFAPALERALAASNSALPGAHDAIASKKNHDRYPANQDPANCPICQEMLYAGHYVTPAAIAALAPAWAISIIATVELVPLFVSARSHSWRGRAPPSA